MKRVEKMIPSAIKAVKNNQIEKGGKVDKAFNGYISSFGASIVTSGLYPTLIFFNNKGGSQADRPSIVKAIEGILKENNFLKDENLLEKVKLLVEKEKNAELQRLIEVISDAAVALKLAIRTFHLVESKK